MEVSQRATSSTKEKYSAGMMGRRYGGQLLLLLTYPCCWLWFIVAAAISNKGWSSCRAAPAVPRRVTAGGGGGQGRWPAARWGHPQQAAGLITSSTMLAVLTIIFAQAAPSSNGSLPKSRNGRRGARRHGRTTFCTLPRLPPARRSCRHSSVTTKTMLVDSVALVTRR